jgi:YHS domain-containing protein
MWLLRRFVSWLLRDARDKFQENQEVASGSQTKTSARRLVKDPVCGVHVDETLAAPLREGDQMLHFCSMKCRDRYLGEARKFAANS